MSNFTLESIKIDRIKWGADAGKFEGQLCVGDEKAKMTFDLDDVSCKQLLRAIPEALTSTTLRLHNDFAQSLSRALKDNPEVESL